jgi:hypothetical protein
MACLACAGARLPSAEAPAGDQAAAITALAREKGLAKPACAPAADDPSRLEWTAQATFHDTADFVAVLARELPRRCSERLSIHLQRDRPRHELAVGGTIGSAGGPVPCASLPRLSAVLAALRASIARETYTTQFSQEGSAMVVEGVAARPEEANALWQALLEGKLVDVVQFSQVGTDTEIGSERPRFRLEGTLPE